LSLQLFRAKSKTEYASTPAVHYPAAGGELLAVHELPDQASLALIFRMTPPRQKPTRFRIDTCNQDLEVLSTITYVAEEIVLPEDLHWLRLDSGYVPGWVIPGFTPPLEKPAFDPWNPDPEDLPEIRFYYLDSAGIHSVAAPENMRFLTVLRPTSAQSLAGEIPVLLGSKNSNGSFAMDYASAVVTASQGQKRPVLEGIQPLSFGKHRMFLGTDPAVQFLPVLSLSTHSFVAQTALATMGTEGEMRVNFLQTGSRAPDGDYRLLPRNFGDLIQRLAGVFDGDGRRGLFTQTSYDLQYHDLIQDKVWATSLHRFSFLQNLSFYRQFLPVVVGANEARLPGMLAFGVGGDFGEGEISEVVVPGSQSLQTPARLRLRAGPGCLRVRNPIEASTEQPSALLFYCAEGGIPSFVKVVLQ